MFGFCPMDSNTKCGVTKKLANGLPDTNLGATKDKQQVASTDIKYVKGSSSVRRADHCYYLIKLTSDTAEQQKLTSNQYIEFQVNKKTNMNVYVYEGIDRETATKSVVDGNAQALAGTTYRVKQDSGLLIISYPDQDKDAEIDFQYWIGDTRPTDDDDDDDGLMIGIIVAACIAVILVCVIVGVVIFRSRKNAVEIGDQ